MKNKYIFLIIAVGFGAYLVMQPQVGVSNTSAEILEIFGFKTPVGINCDLSINARRLCDAIKNGNLKFLGVSNDNGGTSGGNTGGSGGSNGSGSNSNNGLFIKNKFFSPDGSTLPQRTPNPSLNDGCTPPCTGHNMACRRRPGGGYCYKYN